MLSRTLEPEVMDTPGEAAGYDAMDHSGPNAAFVERLIQLGAHGRMLDIGTGPGHIPLLLCQRLVPTEPQRIEEIVAVDLAEHMLAIAAEHRSASRYADRVRFARADAKGLDFPDASFDTVFSNTILHHIPDPRPFLTEAARVLRPGGVLLVRDLFRPIDATIADEIVAQYAGSEPAPNQELFRASLHAALTPKELRKIADEAGLAHAELVVDSDRHMSLQIGAAGSA